MSQIESDGMPGKHDRRPEKFASPRNRLNDHHGTDLDLPAALRPCVSCGAPGKRPSVAFSQIIDATARLRHWTDADLAKKVGISAGYCWTLRHARSLKRRPSLTVALALIDALELTGDARRIVLESSQVGVGRDREQE